MFELPIAPSPEALGVSSKGLLKYLDALSESGLEIHSLVMLRGGEIVTKINFAPYDDRTPHMLFSLSKSFCSAAAGFAVAEGLLKWEDRVIDILPDKAPENLSEGLKKITLESLLCMGSGLAEESDKAEGEDWAKYVLSCDVKHEPMTHFHYNSLGTYLVSCMVQRVTGMTIRDYLVPRLFDKLDIPKPDWDTCPMGVCCGGWGLHLSSDSIARFGQCLIDHGMWQGERVLPEGWVERATSKHISNGDNPNNDWNQGYGYQFWRTRYGRYRGDGAFGQICLIDEKLNTVVAVTAGLNDIAKELQIMHDHLFPAIGGKAATIEEQAAYKARLETLSYPWPTDDRTSRARLGRYVNDNGDAITIGKRDDVLVLTLEMKEDGGEKTTVLFGRGAPVEQVMPFSAPGVKPLRFLGAFGWCEGKQHVLLRTPDGPIMLRAVFTYDDEGVTIESEAVSVKLEGRFVKES